MSTQHFYCKLSLKNSEANRLFWNGIYFNLEAYYLLNKQIESVEEAQTYLKKATLVVRLVPFKNEFKSKLFSHILNTNHVEKSKIFAFMAELNVFENKILDILDFREVEGDMTAQGAGNFSAQESHSAKLTPSEQESLVLALEKLVANNMHAPLTEPFSCLVLELFQEEWKERIPSRRKKGALIPYQALFPLAGPIEREFKDELYVLEDMYCVSPQCPCDEVICFVLSFDHQSGKEILHGGFKYHFTKKTVKNHPDYPFEFNAQEWFKQFSARQTQPVVLPFLFEKRYETLRKLF